MKLAIAAGGDGVVGGVITHLAASELPLGILPLGTANDIARSFRIPQHLPYAVEVLAQGHTQPIDVGVARPAAQAPRQAQQESILASKAPQKQACFAHALTVGLNVQFARIATNVATRQRFGRLAYPVAALEALRSHEALEVGLHFDGLFFPPAHRFRRRARQASPASLDAFPALRCRAFQVTVVNTPLFGGRWQFAIPAASFSDRRLDIVVIEERDIGDLNKRLAHFFHPEDHPSEQSARTHASYLTRYPAELTGIPGIHHLQARGVIHRMQLSVGRCEVRHQCRFRSRVKSCRSWCQLLEEIIHNEEGTKHMHRYQETRSRRHEAEPRRCRRLPYRISCLSQFYRFLNSHAFEYLSTHGSLMFSGRTCLGLPLCGETCRTHDTRVPEGEHDGVQGKAGASRRERSSRCNGADDPHRGAMLSNLSPQWSAKIPTPARNPRSGRALLPNRLGNERTVRL